MGKLSQPHGDCVRTTDSALRQLIRETLLHESMGIASPEGAQHDEYMRLVELGKSSYATEEKGLIMLWGDLLYLVYHQTPRGYLDDAAIEALSNLATEYYWARKDGDKEKSEEIMDWVSDGQGCPVGRDLSCGKLAVDEMLQMAAEKTVTKVPLTVKRTGRSGMGVWASYTVSPEAYDQSVGEGDTTMGTFTLRPGTPIIAAHGLADDWEVVAKLDQSMVEK